MKKTLITLLIIFIFPLIEPLFSDSIDLVKLQKKEAKRRKKTKKSKFKLTDNSILSLTKGKKINYIKTDAVFKDESTEKKGLVKKKKKEDPKTTKEYWANRMKSNDEKIRKLKVEISKTQLEINKAQTDYLTLSLPLQINNAKNRFDMLTRKLVELKKRLELANIAKENIYEEARKSNVPPGWLR